MPIGFDSCMRCGKVIGGISYPTTYQGSFCPSCRLIIHASKVDHAHRLRGPGPLPTAIIQASAAIFTEQHPTRIDAIVGPDGLQSIGDWIVDHAPKYMAAATATNAGGIQTLGYAHILRTGVTMPATSAVLFSWQSERPELPRDADPVGLVGTPGMTMYRLETFRGVTAAEWLTAKSDALFMLRRTAE